MPRYIIKLNDRYMEYSTVIDDIITYPLTLEEFKKYYLKEYGECSVSKLEEKLERVEQNGTSSMIFKNVYDIIKYNRAGEDEDTLTIPEFLDYVKKLEKLENSVED